MTLSVGEANAVAKVLRWIGGYQHHDAWTPDAGQALDALLLLSAAAGRRLLLTFDTQAIGDAVYAADKRLRELATKVPAVVTAAPVWCSTDSVAEHALATVLVDGEPRCDFCAALIGDRGHTRTPLNGGTES